MTRTKGGILASLALLVPILAGLYTMGWLPMVQAQGEEFKHMVQAQGEELKQMIQKKPDSKEVARHLVLFYQGRLRGELNELANAEFDRDRDPGNVKKREAVTDAEIAVDATRVELRNQNRIWKGIK